MDGNDMGSGDSNKNFKHVIFSFVLNVPRLHVFFYPKLSKFSWDFKPNHCHEVLRGIGEKIVLESLEMFC